jgi:hypothetical protein
MDSQSNTVIDELMAERTASYLDFDLPADFSIVCGKLTVDKAQSAPAYISIPVGYGPGGKQSGDGPVVKAILAVQGIEESALVANMTLREKLILGFSRATDIDKEIITITKIGDTEVDQRRLAGGGLAIELQIAAASAPAASALEKKVTSVSVEDINKGIMDTGVEGVIATSQPTASIVASKDEEVQQAEPTN